MGKIRDGNAAIEFLKREGEGWVFRFTSFPDKLRGNVCSSQVGSGEWRAFSAFLPAVYSGRLACPGKNRDFDDIELIWPGTKPALLDLLAAINKFAGPGKQHSWWSLRKRVRVYRKRIGGE